MRTLIKDYTFTAGTRSIDCSSCNPFDIENIRLIVNETQKVVLCSSMQKNLIVSIIDGVITYVGTLPVLAGGDKLTIEIDKGENYPNSIAVLSEIVEAKKGIADAIVFKGGTASEVSSFAELETSIKGLPNFNLYGTIWQTGFEPTNLFEFLNNKRLYLTEINNEVVQNIDSYAFSYCTNLTTVSLPLAQTLGSHAFIGCTNLTTASLPLAQTLGTSIFQSCTNLTTVLLPLAQTLGTSIFLSCTNLTTVSLPLAQTLGNSTFQSCTNLTTVLLPLAQTLGTSIFLSCTNLTTVSLPLAQTLGNSTFQSCTNLTTVSLPLAQTLGTSVFSSCTNLTSVTLGKLISFGSSNTFLNCHKLSNIVIGADTNINLDFSSLSSVTWNTNIDATVWNENFVNGIINNLFDFTSGAARTIKLGVHPYAKLTPETIALAAAKNWNITA